MCSSNLVGGGYFSGHCLISNYIIEHNFLVLQVARDHVLKGWEFPEGENASGPWGSGYPGIDMVLVAQDIQVYIDIF